MKMTTAQPALTCSKLIIETLEQRCGMFKVNNKDTKKTPLAYCIVNFEHISLLCSSVSIVNFEQINADWVNAISSNA